MDETERRRALQLAYNEKHGITPETVQKGVRSGLEQVLSARKVAAEAVQQSAEQLERGEAIAQLQAAMLAAAEELDFERAARLRDRIQEIEAQEDQATVPSTMLDVDQSIGKKRKGTKGRRKPSPRT
jgi:excinuclease ABC subunit B